MDALRLPADLERCRCILVAGAGGGFDKPDFAGRLLAWRRAGYMAVDGRVFDCGIQTGRALAALQRGASPVHAGPSGDMWA